MELYIFGRFLVRAGEEQAFELALREVVTLTWTEAGGTGHAPRELAETARY